MLKCDIQQIKGLEKYFHVTVFLSEYFGKSNLESFFFLFLSLNTSKRERVSDVDFSRRLKMAASETNWGETGLSCLSITGSEADYRVRKSRTPDSALWFSIMSFVMSATGSCQEGVLFDWPWQVDLSAFVGSSGQTFLGASSFSLEPLLYVFVSFLLFA